LGRVTQSPREALERFGRMLRKASQAIPNRDQVIAQRANRCRRFLGEFS